MARYTAVLDACVLAPVTLADTLLRIAERELFRPLWSEEILGEATDAILEMHPDIDADAVNARFDDMRSAFEDACVVGWETVEVNVVLPDPDDIHVVAAAIRGRADCIVTANLDDFPPEELKALEIEVAHPDKFLLDQLDLSPRVVLEVVREQAAHCISPLLEPVDVVNALARCGAPQFAAEVRRAL